MVLKVREDKVNDGEFFIGDYSDSAETNIGKIPNIDALDKRWKKNLEEITDKSSKIVA